MPLTTANELRKQTDDQLLQLIRENEKQLFTLRFQSATDRLETPSEMRKVRKEIARLKTILRQRELEKLQAEPIDNLKSQLAAAETGFRADGKPFVGKRKPKRQVNRLTGMIESRLTAEKKANKTANAGKGK